MSIVASKKVQQRAVLFVQQGSILLQLRRRLLPVRRRVKNFRDAPACPVDRRQLRQLLEEFAQLLLLLLRQHLWTTTKRPETRPNLFPLLRRQGLFERPGLFFSPGQRPRPSAWPHGSGQSPTGCWGA